MGTPDLVACHLLYWTLSASWCCPVRSYHHCSHVQQWSAGSILYYIAALYRPARLACTSGTHECALETHETSCVPRAAKLFFIPAVHSPLGAVWHVIAPELPSQKGRFPSRGTYSSAGVHLGKEREVQIRETCDGTRVHLCRDVWSKTTSYIIVRRYTSYSFS
jgi:hypothetical protein